MEIEWISVEERLPENKVIVDTKIDDLMGERNIGRLQRWDKLWFVPDGGIYVLHEKLAKSHPSLERGMVWCRTCGRSEKVDSSECLRSGWPKCCGYTMTIDHPSTWNLQPKQ